MLFVISIIVEMVAFEVFYHLAPLLVQFWIRHCVCPFGIGIGIGDPKIRHRDSCYRRSGARYYFPDRLSMSSTFL